MIFAARMMMMANAENFSLATTLLKLCRLRAAERFVVEIFQVRFTPLIQFTETCVNLMQYRTPSLKSDKKQTSYPSACEGLEK